MTTKRRLLSALTRADLLLLGRAFELQVSPRMSLDELQGELSRSKRATLDKILPELPDQAIVLTAEFKYAEPGRYRGAARVTDVFGNDGIAAVAVEVK